jgi:hypothetical protein
MISKDRLGAFGTAMFVAACASPAPTPNPDTQAYTYRTTIENSQGEQILLYSDDVRYPKMPDGKSTDIVIVDVFCPSEVGCEDFFQRDQVSGSDVSLGRIDPLTYRRIEFTNQLAQYISCGKPVPSPFTKGENCGQPTS